MVEYFRNGRFFFIVSYINMEFGGLTNAMLQRARIFSKEANLKPTILTFNFNPSYNLIRSHLLKKGKITSDITILNMYEYYEKLPEMGLLPDDSYLDQDSLINYCKLKTVEEVFDSLGRLRKMIADDDDNGITYEFYYTSNKRCFMVKQFQRTAYGAYNEKISLFDEGNRLIMVCNTDQELIMHWLNVLSTTEDPCFFIVDGRDMDQHILSFEKTNSLRIFVSHSIHIEEPYETDSPIKNTYRLLLNNFKKSDAIVLHTEAQKKDVELILGENERLFVIPHCYKKPDNPPDFTKRDLKKAIVIARYHKVKQLDHIIKAFKTVLDIIPNLRLELYGKGDQENVLSELIEKLQLQDHVFLKGYSENPRDIFEEAAFSVVTSKSEGFSLATLESLSHGCPVISYDLKYGPSVMINHGFNGYLVPKDDINSLAQKMKELFLNPEKLRFMSGNAYQSINAFHEELFMDNWWALFQKILVRRKFS
ncbi:glycosyltransferase [Paenibacillus sp. 32O-W]|uniref:glycosyltransferase n=1 Tax=Paenibacillus sp. 32O-W TaxID=1695218 RepID=UPI0011A0EBF9|nr:MULTISPECIES: glycosyltransferase [Paenibacillaceae]